MSAESFAQLAGRLPAGTATVRGPDGTGASPTFPADSFTVVSVDPPLVDRVINCTGPTWNPRRLDHPLVQGLVDRGLLRPDALGIGFDVDDDGALVDADANPSDQIFAIGPLRNGVLLETTAVPEIGQQAELLAELLLASLSARLGSSRELSAA